MRDPETDRLLTDVRRAVTAARAGGVTIRACIFDATVAAVDEDPSAWPSAEARRTAESACRAVEPPTTARQNADGSWTPSGPAPITGDFDAEVYGTGPWTWIAYRGGCEVATGHARTRLGLQVALLRARRRTRKASR